MIISEPVRHSRDDFTFKLLDVDRIWHRQDQGGHKHHATNSRDSANRHKRYMPTTPAATAAANQRERSGDDVSEQRLADA